MLTFCEHTGVLPFRNSEGKPVANLRLRVEGGGAQGAVALFRGNDGVLRGRAGAVALEVRTATLDGGFAAATVRVIPAEPTRLERLGLSLEMADAGRALLARDAWLMPLGESLGAGHRAAGLGSMLDAAEGSVTLHAIGVLLHHAGQAMLVGVGGVVPDFPAFTTDGQTANFAFEIGHPLVGPTEYSVVLGLGGDPHALLEGYGDLLARGGRRVGEVPTGWNSWDYYQGAVTMDDLRAEMAAINASPLRGRLKYLTIDMGWENCWGDWRPNRKFPASYAETAAEIRAAGFEPGIWLAPLQASTYLPLARQERDMFCRDAEGELIIASGRDTCTLFDPTHPWTEAWLHDLCSELRQAGFSLFKIDYIYRDYLNMMGPLHRPETGKAAAARRFMEIIRQAIGEDAHLLSCGVPLPAAFGLADSARISTDIHNFWGHVVNSATQIAVAYWLGGRVWVNDPDFALIRSPQTSDDPYLNVPYRRSRYDGSGFWMAGDDASFAELKTWLALAHLCGGSLFCSDAMGRLNARGMDALTRLLAEPTTPARPLDLLTHIPPRVWANEERLGLFNFADEPAEIELPGNTPGSGTDFWTGEKVTLGTTVHLPAHGSLLVKL